MDEKWINFIHDDVDNNIDNNIFKQPCNTIIHGFTLSFIVKTTQNDKHKKTTL